MSDSTDIHGHYIGTMSYISDSPCRSEVPAWANDAQTYHFTLLGHTVSIMNTMIRAQSPLLREKLEVQNDGSLKDMGVTVEEAIETIYATLKKASA